MIETDGLCVRLGDTEVLHRVSLRVARGGFLAVVGPNGAGKSTLLRCLDGIIRPSSGRVEVDGRPLAQLSRRELARTVSYVPQPDGSVLEFTVRSFVEMGRFPHLGSWAALTATDVAAVREAMELTEVAALAERSMASLSGGERQRASIAAALAHGGSVLLLDEPTSFLDYRHQGQVLDLVDRLHRERGLTVVAVTHDLNSTVPSADAVIALKEGRVVFEGRPAELLREQTLASIFDAEFNLVAGGHRGLPIVQPARSGP